MRAPSRARSSSATQARPIVRSASDVLMLSERVRATNARVQVEVSTLGDSICVLDTSEAAVETWIADERAWLLRPLQKAQMDRLVDEQRGHLADVVGLGRFATLPASLQTWVEPIMGKMVPEDRTEEIYLAEVEAYLDAARSKVANEAVRGFLDDACCELVVVVQNPTDGNIPGVELEVTLDDDVTLNLEESDLTVLPERPRLWGPRKVGGFDLEALSRPSFTSLSPHFGFPSFPSLHSDHRIAGQTVVYHVGHLRPAGRYESEPIPLLISNSGQKVSARWAATSAVLDGVVEGTFELTLAPIQEIAQYVPHRAD